MSIEFRNPGSAGHNSWKELLFDKIQSLELQIIELKKLIKESK